MTEASESGGQERRQHDRFVVRKKVELSTSTKTYDGILRDISVGGAAIKIRAPLYQAHIVTVDINDLGAYEGQVLRSIDDEHVAIEFETTEAQSVDLAAKLVGVYYGNANEPNPDSSGFDNY